MAATWEDVFIDLGLMSDADYERVNNMSLQEMGRYITMMTRDPLYWNKWKAKRWLKVRDQSGACPQLSPEEQKTLESIRTDPKHSRVEAPFPPVPGVGTIHLEFPIKRKAKSREQGLRSQEKSPGSATAIPSSSPGAGVRTAKGTKASGKSSGAKIKPHEYPSTFGGRSQLQTDSKKDDLDCLDEALCHRHAGDVCYLNGEHVDAVLAYSKGLDLLQRGPSQESPPVMRLLYEEGRQQLLASRVVVLRSITARLRAVENDDMWAGERDLPGTLCQMFNVRNYRDCVAMMADDPHGDLAYTVAAMEVGTFSRRAAAETLMVAVERCTDTRGIKVSLKDLVRQGVRVGNREANKKELDAMHLRMMGDVVPSHEELCGTLKDDPRSAIVLAQPLAEGAHKFMEACMKQWSATLYQCPPYTQPLAQWNDEDLQKIDGDEVPSLKQACLAAYPEGLYGELGLAKWLPDPNKHGASLELAKRCNLIGNREARAGRLVQAGLWYTRGLLVLLPEGRNHVDRMPAGTKAVALALALNRGLMYGALDDHERRTGGEIGPNHGLLCIYDLAWCTYFGHGWVWALLALCKWHESPVGYGDAGESLMLVTAELKRLGANAPTQLVKEASRLQQQTRSESSLSKPDSMEEYPATLKFILDESWEECEKKYPKQNVRPGHYRSLQQLQLCDVTFSWLKQLLDTARVHDRL